MYYNTDEAQKHYAERNQIQKATFIGNVQIQRTKGHQ